MDLSERIHPPRATEVAGGQSHLNCISAILKWASLGTYKATLGYQQPLVGAFFENNPASSLLRFWVCASQQVWITLSQVGQRRFE